VYQLRVGGNVLADEAEGCLYPVSVQQIEHLRSPARIGSVIEGQCHRRTVHRGCMTLHPVGIHGTFTRDRPIDVRRRTLSNPVLRRFAGPDGSVRRTEQEQGQHAAGSHHEVGSPGPVTVSIEGPHDHGVSTASRPELPILAACRSVRPSIAVRGLSTVTNDAAEPSCSPAGSARRRTGRPGSCSSPPLTIAGL
jgi:hypothetical protein